MLRRSTLALLSLMLLLPLGCSQTKTPPTTKEVVKKAPATVLTEKEALAFAEKLALDIGDKNFSELEDVFDYDSFLDICFGKLDLPEAGYREISQSFKQELKQTPGGLFQNLTDGTLKVLRYHEDDGQPKVLIRALVGDPPALTYLDLHLIKNGETIQTFDIFSFAAGERVSESVTRLVLPLVSQMKQTPLQKLVKSGNNEIEHLEEIMAVINAQNSGDLQGAISLYEKLPKDVQDKKVVLLVYITALMDAGDNDKYLAGLEKFNKLYSDDPSSFIHQLDFHFLNKDFDKMRAAIDQLEERLKVKDPYLDVMRATGYLESKDYEPAIKHIREAIKAEPELEVAHWALSNTALTDKNFQVVAESLDGLKQFYPDTLAEDLKINPEYSEFFESELGKKWLAAQ